VDAVEESEYRFSGPLSLQKLTESSLGCWLPFAPVQQHRIFVLVLGCSLLPLLADGPSTFLAPLLTCPRRLGPCNRRAD
jgi:hypothetical protein